MVSQKHVGSKNMKRKLKNMKGKAGIILLATLATILVIPSIIPITVAEQYHNGNAPDDLDIISITMSDYNVRCKAMGGQYVGIVATVKNNGDTTITEDFSVDLFISQSTALTSEDVTEDLSPSETYRVDFGNVYIDLGIGSYTMDSYINNDGSTRKYCNFIVTLLGLS